MGNLAVIGILICTLGLAAHSLLRQKKRDSCGSCPGCRRGK